jgi:hypothetical protein
VNSWRANRVKERFNVPRCKILVNFTTARVCSCCSARVTLEQVWHWAIFRNNTHAHAHTHTHTLTRARTHTHTHK